MATETPLPPQCGANVLEMTNGSCGFDVTIVCCSTNAHAEYWQRRLDKSYGAVLRPGSIALAVSEHAWGDGKGGAGNALGTLYAYTQAVEKAKTRGIENLTEKLKAGEISVAIYHTAGKGTRLAPLPAAENNNKPAVKLPKMLNFTDGPRPISILEAVIKQTAAYAPYRKGRLSVFWGDQVFVPTVSHAYEPSSHVDILAKLGPMPSKEEWEAKGLHRYGLIAVSANGEAAQIEKVTYEQAIELLSTLGTVTQVGTSLGSFSISATLLEMLLNEYSAELAARRGAKDTDPHWWMPMTLSREGYLSMMEKKGVSNDDALLDFGRVQRMREALLGGANGSGTMQIFNAVNVGPDCCWWDYGQLKLYRNSMSLLRGDSHEAELYRRFLQIESRVADSDANYASIDDQSIIQHCEFSSGTVRKTVACDVCVGHIEANEAVLINVTAKKVIAPKGSIIYNIVDDSEEGIWLDSNQACVGVWDEGGNSFTMKAFANEDQKAFWEKAREGTGNPCCYAEIYESNLATDVTKVEEQRDVRANDIRDSIVDEPDFCSIS